MRYKKSNELFKRANKVIPLASQTFSKSYISYPKNHAPLFLTHGKDGHVWDVDGNEYVDFVNGLLPNVLGYNDKDIIKEVKKNLHIGPTLSMASEYEIMLAEELVKIIPCAEMVRFGKNGTDVTSAAIRLARAYTKRERIATCGYHGWQDWYIDKTSRNKGVPKAVQNLTSVFPYNDLSKLDEVLNNYPNEFAAVIMEPMTFEKPNKGYLESVRKITRKHGCLLIFDEIITGFRFDIGGAQKLFGVTPDIATFGKSMGNGFPISAIVGKKKFMKQMEEIFFSSTFGGEIVSIIAALAVIKKMKMEPVIDEIYLKGSEIIKRVSLLINDYNLKNFFSVTGHPSWSIININGNESMTQYQIKTLLLQDFLNNGILSSGTHNVCFKHTKRDINKLIKVYELFFEKFRDMIDKELCIEDFLVSPVVKPIFKIRP